MTGADLEQVPEVWAGVECAHVAVGDRWVDQLALTGLAERPETIALAGRLHVTAVRCPVLWGWPDGRAETDWAWAERAVDALAGRGIRPIVGLLHHGSGPSGSTLVDPDFPSRFAAYAATVARRLSGVTEFLPINEPLTTARFAGLYGWWQPHARDHRMFVRMLLNQVLAIRAAARVIRAERPGATIVVNEDVGRTRGTRPVRAAVRFDNARRWLTFDLLTGRVDPAHSLWPYLAEEPAHRATLDSLRRDPEPPDILGLDYYVTSDRFLDHRLERYPPAAHGGDGRLRYADVELVRAHPAGIGGFRRAIAEAWARYGLPLALTEVHLAGEEQDQVAWWVEAWRAAEEARRGGIPVRAVTAWAALGTSGWSSLLGGSDLRYEPGAFDLRARPPRLTASGRAIARVALGRPPAVQGRGWWRRADRLTFGPELTDGRLARAPGAEARVA